MRAVLRPSSLLLVGAAVVLVAGCSGSSGGRMEVTGEVKLVGQPIQDGTIVFKPLENQDTQGGAQIVKGAYKVPRQQGLKPGKYVVQISSGDAKTPVNLPEDAAPGPSSNITSVDMVPEDWNIRSKHEVTVKANESNRFDFEVPEYSKEYSKRHKPPKQ
jgi:hypothetical protein